MTERTMSPTAARAQVRRATKNRFKILRQDSRPVREIKVDPQRVFAERLVSLLREASSDNPGEWSPAYCEWVVNGFTDRYLELARVAPLAEKVGAR